ncbi:hypothetical protein C8J56DRAFT_899703 [Mycena floridula]|nr:hypothetical protein C8J56DRAFT_899703 [Mycena floridula]
MARETTTDTTSDPPKKRHSADTTSSHLSRRSRKVNVRCPHKIMLILYSATINLLPPTARLRLVSIGKGPVVSGIATDSLGVGPDPGFGGRNFAMGGNNGMGAGPSQIEVNIVSRHIQSIVSATVRTLKEPSHNPEANGAELESGRLAEQIITTVFIYKCPIIDRLLANF